MKFIFGGIPDNSDFNPESENWTAIKEPSPWIAQLIGIPVAFLAIILLVIFWYFFAPVRNFKIDIGFETIFWIIGIGIIHELIHAVFHPGCGISSNTYLGFWPSKLVLYAHYHSILSKYRFMAILISPFIFLSIVPLIVCSILHYSSTELCMISLFNALLACVDILGFFLILFGVPSDSFVQNKGWKTYYKSAEQMH